MYEYKVKEIVKVVDGDTVDVIIDLGFDLLKKERVRLAGIDTPETRTRDHREKAYGLEAKAYLKERLEGCESLMIKTEKDGKYGRMLGWFFGNKAKKSINLEMVDLGYAWTYDGGTKEKSLLQLDAVRGKLVIDGD
ncbi:thermonuclease family protein [Marinobacter sp.]|jgi:micrococcal nuclease|uniref:thermonuclease family protein n=1 Tax=Marinobacter sp. TaxID=50741 RepID=UPI000C91AE4A|nr:thermonuclease family protein [Marinobacter sp.]MAK51602.1 nuclease [Marinobacter sp.]|tara:strand:- start:1787 stop:2194 length:408 start_codon:yes stop_codon:yes gene_type:complete